MPSSGPRPATAAAARVERKTIHVPSLEENPAGEPAEQSLIVYLPPSYDTAPQRRYPLIVLLHGIADSPDTWLRAHYIPELLDRLSAEKKAPEFIVAMPNGGTKFLGSSTSTRR